MTNRNCILGHQSEDITLIDDMAAAPRDGSIIMIVTPAKPDRNDVVHSPPRVGTPELKMDART